MRAHFKSAGRQSRGQAAVETALVMPLVLFLILGILQLGLIQNARALTQYAAFNSVRAGAVGYGDCNRMAHSAAATLLPAIESFTFSGSPATGIANAFAARHPTATTFLYNPARDDGHDRTIFWLDRQRPLLADVTALPDDENTEFDDPEPGQPQFRLEAQLVFWFPLRIPFVNWIMARMILAHWGITSFVGRNPIINNGQTVNFGDNVNPPTLAAGVATELASRVAAGQYEFPITASYTMRMMTPVKKKFFTTQGCIP